MLDSSGVVLRDLEAKGRRQQRRRIENADTTDNGWPDRIASAFTPQIAAGLSESLVTMFVGFGCLTVIWLCVTLGLWRRP